MAKKVNLHIGESEMRAILTALDVFDTATESVDDLSQFTFTSFTLRQKLHAHSSSFSSEETLLFSFAIKYALEVQSGKHPEVYSILDKQCKADLSAAFFTLNRLSAFIPSD